MIITIIQQPELRLIALKAESAPEGIKAVWQALEERFDMKGRKAFGLVYATPDGGMEYFAALVSKGELEERTSGLVVKEVPAGPCARTKLMNWRQHIDQIAPLIGQMNAEVDVDPNRPAMEYYRSFDELHLLVPIKAGS